MPLLMMVCRGHTLHEISATQAHVVMHLQFGSGEMGNKRSDGVVSLFPVVQVCKDDSVVLGLGRDE